MKRIAIDLTWVRPGKVGGTESCVRNLLDGFSEINCKDYKLCLLVTKDNIESFAKYQAFQCFELLRCDVNSTNLKQRVMWQNLKMGKLLHSQGIRSCLEPVYGKPFFGTKGITFVTTIHDLQANHYPQYFNKGRVAWMKTGWLNAVRTSKLIIAISDYVKKDIIDTYRLPNEKVKVIYDAVVLDTESLAPIDTLDKYGIKKGKYYYTVSSLFLHKNLKTAVLALAELKKRGSKAFYPLVISGIGGRKRDELDHLIAENGLAKDIVFTSFVNNAERNRLYKECRTFLFTSVFEGFGMPPIEAMAMGTPVLSSAKTSLAEVTRGLCNYVENPLDPVEWADRLEREIIPAEMDRVQALLNIYDKKTIAKEYIAMFDEVF